MNRLLILAIAVAALITGPAFGQTPSASSNEISLHDLGFDWSDIAQPGPKFSDPPVIRSRNGVLKATLIVEYSNPYKTSVGPDKLIHVRSYDGHLVGPTLRVKPGDWIKLRMVNWLPPEASVPPCSDFDAPPSPPSAKQAAASTPAKLEHLLRLQHAEQQTMMMSMGGPAMMTDKNMDIPHGFNSTNLHTHGLHVSPSGHSDNVFVEIDPGKEFDYQIHVPLDQPPGTYWYHAHKHGSVAMQLASGMSGAIIVDGGMDKQPQVKDAKERIFVLQQLSYLKNKKTGLQEVECFDDSFGPGTWIDFETALGRRTTINGLRMPVIDLHPGAVERWRFIHAGIREEIEPILIGPVLPGAKTTWWHPLYAVAYDGLTTGSIVKEEKIVLAPAYREDVLVKAPTMPGTYYLWDGPSPKGMSDTEKVGHLLATIRVRGYQVGMNLPTSDELLQYKPKLTRYIPEGDVTGHQSATYGVYPDPNNPKKVKFYIDHREYSMNETPRTLYLGDVDDWTLESAPLSETKYAEPHPFHIHVNSFQITSIDGFDPFISPILDQLHGQLWKDTLLMQPGCVYHVRMRYDDFTGKFVDHCHILDHEDQGMMENVVIKPRRPGPGKNASAVTAVKTARHADASAK